MAKYFKVSAVILLCISAIITFSCKKSEEAKKPETPLQQNQAQQSVNTEMEKLFMSFDKVLIHVKSGEPIGNITYAIDGDTNKKILYCEYAAGGATSSIDKIEYGDAQTVFIINYKEYNESDGGDSGEGSDADTGTGYRYKCPVDNKRVLEQKGAVELKLEVDCNMI